MNLMKNNEIKQIQNKEPTLNHRAISDRISVCAIRMRIETRLEKIPRTLMSPWCH